MKKINGYSFKNYEGLFCDENGNFKLHGKLLKKYWRVGQIYILINGKKVGMNTLRKQAEKTIINEEIYPF